MAVREFPDGRFAVVYREPGKKNPTTESFGRGPAAKQAAQERDLEIKLLKKRGKLTPRSEAVYLDALAQAYTKDAKMRGKSPRYLKDFTAILNKSILPALCYKTVDQISYAEVLDVAERLWGHLSMASQQRYLSYLKAIFAFGVRHEITKHNPLGKWKRLQEPKLDFKLTVEDLEKIIHAAPPYLAWALEVEWELGTRPGVTELFGIRWDDVDYEAGLVRVRGSKTKSSDRYVAIAPWFAWRLKEKQKTARCDYIVEYRGGPITTFRIGLKNAAKRAGIAYNVRPYDIRHLYASVMLAGGADLAAVSKLLGHSTIATTTSTYYHVMQGEKARATALRPAIKKPPVSQNVSQDEAPD